MALHGMAHHFTESHKAFRHNEAVIHEGTLATPTHQIALLLFSRPFLLIPFSSVLSSLMLQSTMNQATQI